MILPGVLLSAWATFTTKSRFQKYSEIPNKRGTSGAEVARYILDRANLRDVRIDQASGMLSDHYSPADRAVRLSPDVFNGRSIASLAIAAHEVGHAIQHRDGYAPLALRNISIPAANIGSNFSWIIIMAGMALHMLSLAKFGVVLFAAVVFFQVLTLPVEFDASSRAKQILFDENLVTQSEREGVSKVLSAAAMTYVAAATSAVMTLLYFMIRTGLLGGGRRRD